MKKLLTMLFLTLAILSIASAGDYEQLEKLVASDRAVGDNFGYSVSISGDVAIVGSYYEDEDASGGATKSNAGSAYIFRREGSTWIQEAKIVASDRDAEDKFGVSVSISGDVAIVGAYREDEDASGGDYKLCAGSANIYLSVKEALGPKRLRSSHLIVL